MKTGLRLMLVTALGVLASLQGCAVIHFENGEALPPPDTFFNSMPYWFSEDTRPAERSTEPESSMYHHGIFQLVEFSNALELDHICTGREWNRVSTEVTPFNLVLGVADNALLSHFSSAGLDLWSPWTLEYTCRD